ncbi:MAG: metallophosphoesterase [Planctomycetaceae bacterium]|nr:metallophosphoesterase [Planctomycetaceae bacterium]
MAHISRRDMLKGAAIGAAAVVAPSWLSRLAKGDAPAATQPAKPVTITLFNTGDMHDHCDSLPRIAGFVKAAKAKDPNTLLIDAGDIWNDGNSQLAGTSGEGIVSLIDKSGYDACTTGNHDYTYGKKRVLEMSAKYAGWPLTLANVNWTDQDKPLTKNIAQYRIFELHGVKVCIAGGACQYGNHVHGEALPLIHEREGYLRVLPDIRKKADVFIFISHLWDASDRRMIAAWGDNAPDLVIGGHTHARNKWVQGRTTVIKAGFWGQCVGRSVITYDPAAAKVTEVNCSIIDIGADWPVDPAVKDLLDSYLKPAQKKT